MFKRAGVIAFLLVFMAGCSSKFGYNNLDWLLYWYLDDYIELDKSQKAVFDERLDTWLAWHRSEELPAYRQHLVDLRASLAEGPLEANQWLQQFARGRGHWERFRDHLVPELTEMAPLLTDQQVEDLFAKLEEDNNDEVEEYNEESADERQKDRVKRLKKQVKNWIGRLSDEQETIVETYAPQFQSNFENWIRYRRHIQSEAKQVLLSRHDNPEFSSQLAHLMTHPEAYQDAEYQQTSDHNRNLFAQLIAELNPTLSARQKRHVNEEIDDLIDDLDDLIKD